MSVHKTILILVTSLLLVACGGESAGENDESNNDNGANSVENDGNDEPGNDGNDEPGNDGNDEPGNDGNDEPGNDGNDEPGNDEPGNDESNNGNAEFLSQQYPGDEGIGDDPAVIWHEDFEQATIDELADLYDQARTDGMSFSSDPPENSAGSQSVVMEAGGDLGSATDLYTRLPDEDGYDQLYIRYYFRHHADSNYHHTRANLGGYNPPSAWPQGGAGTRPDGDDRLSVTVEPLTSGPERRMDFYNYWMNMRSWEADNPPDGEAFGNTLIHDSNFVATDGQWHCLEVMARLNEDPDSAAGGELATWFDGELVEHFTEDGPIGYWIRDKFCPAYADTSACLDYAPPEDEREQEVLDLQWRNSLDLKLNYLWIQNYISQGTGVVEYDDLVVATSRIGCLVPQ